MAKAVGLPSSTSRFEPWRYVEETDITTDATDSELSDNPANNETLLNLGLYDDDDFGGNEGHEVFNTKQVLMKIPKAPR